MIEYINGPLAELSPTEAVIDCGGVGYNLQISVSTYTALQGKERARLYVYESIREDAYTLFGFATKTERQMFLLLKSVKKVGPALARTLLSAFTAENLAAAIAAEDFNTIKAAKGIGPKTAQLVIVELRDKVQDIAAGGHAPAGGGQKAVVLGETEREAVEALVALGYPPAPSQKVVLDIVKAEPGIAIGNIIKQALRLIK